MNMQKPQVFIGPKPPQGNTPTCNQSVEHLSTDTLNAFRMVCMQTSYP